MGQKSSSGRLEQGPQAWGHFQSHLKLQKGRITKTRARSAWTWSKCYLLLGTPSIHPHSPDELEEQMVYSNNNLVQWSLGMAQELRHRGEGSKDCFPSESSYINNRQNYFFNSLLPEPAHLGRALIRPRGNVSCHWKRKRLRLSDDTAETDKSHWRKWLT